jgi:hypothetical protein
MGEPHEERDRMRIDCSVEEHDIAAVQGLLRANGENEFVLGRILDNVSGPVPEFDRGKCWRVMLGCLLTTQQRSGPDSRVVRFLQRNPFEPALVDCSPHCAESAVSRALSAFGGLGRGPTVAKYAAANLAGLEAGDWLRVEEKFGRLLLLRGREPRESDFAEEREAALFIQGAWDGFGPKQSRNFWQWLGLTRFEIPLDSRVIGWLNRNEVFPFELTAQALGDEHYYSFVMDGVRKVCVAPGVLPCVFDAAVFSEGQSWEAGSLEY